MRWDTSKILKKGVENTDKSIWEPSLKTAGAHTHTHILSLMTDSRHSTPERGNKSVVCPVFETAVTLSSAGYHTLCAPSRGPRAPSYSLRDQVQFQSSFFNHTVWLSNRTTKIPLESGSSADKRFRTDLKIFNKNCIIYVSQADVQSERRWVH